MESTEYEKTMENSKHMTANCKICIKLNGTLEEAKALIIKRVEELDNYS